MSACVLHNFCLIHDDFDDSYFLAQHSDDGADNDGGDDYENLDGELGGEDKRIQLMNIICWNVLYYNHVPMNVIPFGSF